MNTAIAKNVDDPQAFDHRFAAVNGIRLHYVEEGQGPLVILLHAALPVPLVSVAASDQGAGGGRLSRGRPGSARLRTIRLS